MNEAHSQFAEYSTSVLVIRNLLHLCELCRVIGFSVEFPIFSNMQTHFFISVFLNHARTLHLINVWIILIRSVCLCLTCSLVNYCILLMT
jgi:hypothetical protein